MTDLNLLNRFLYKLITLTSDFLSTWSDKNIQRLANLLANLMWISLYSRRTYTINAISEHLNLEHDDAKKLAKQSFKENCLSFLEITRTKDFNLNSPNLIISNPELLNLMINSDRPIVACTAHLGSWELFASLLPKLNPTRPTQIITRRHNNPVIQKYMERQRSSHGSEVLGHRNAVFPIMKCLKKKGITGFLVDHKASQSESIMLPFFCAPAPVNQGPAVIALRSNALVIPAFLSRQGAFYKLDIYPPLDPASLSSSRAENIHTIASYYTQSVEQAIKSTPTQWLWLHKRWNKG